MTTPVGSHIVRKAKLLQEDGMTIDEIAQKLGVLSAILAPHLETKSASHQGGNPGGLLTTPNREETNVATNNLNKDSPVTLQQFLAAVFGEVPDTERVVVAQQVNKFENGKEKQVFDTSPATPKRISAIERKPGPWYFCISTTKRDVAAEAQAQAEGSKPYFSREVENCVRTHVMVLDDVMTKAKASPVAPSYILESSPGNFQHGFFLEPTDDFELYDRVFEAVAAAGYSDGGAEGVHRVMRIPGSINIKPGRDSFAARIVEWHPERRWTLESLASEMGLTLAAPMPKRVTSALVGAVPAALGASLLDKIKASGLYHEAAGNEPGAHDMRCPFEHEHSEGGAEFSRYWEPNEKNNGVGGWRCLHGHCNHRNIKDLKEWLNMKAAERRAAQRAENVRIGAGGGGDDQHPKADVLDLEQMLARFVYVGSGQLVFDRDHPRVMFTIPEHRGFYSASKTEIEGKKKSVKTTALWEGHPDRVAVKGITFSAGAPAVTKDPKGTDCVNTWDGWHWPDVAPGDASPFVDHVRHLFKERTEDFLNFLAHMIQRPQELPHSAWLHIAPHQGTGRGWLSGLLTRITQGYCAPCLDLGKLLDSQFNQVLQGTVLAMVDEIREGSGTAWGHAQKMKSMINEPTRTINAKHAAPYIEFNACRWILFSNHRSAIPITDGDRRYEVAICDDAPLAPEYYTALYELLKDPAFIRGVAEYLMARDISGYNPCKPPELTDDKEALIGEMQGGHVSALKELYAEHKHELVTRLFLRAQCVAGGEEPKGFSHIIEDAGWVYVHPRLMLSDNKKHQVYRRLDSKLPWETMSKEQKLAHIAQKEGGDAPD